MKSRLCSIAAALAAATLLFAQNPGNGRANGRGDRPIGVAGPAGFSGNAGPILLNYNGGAVMLGQTHIYYIWYGNWSVDANAAPILNAFANNLAGSPYYNILTQYSQTGPSGNISNSIVLSGSTNSTYVAANPLALTDSDISGIVAAAIGNNSLPLDANGIYFVLTAPGVAETSGFLSVYCGWHSAFSVNGTPIKYSFVGDAAGPNVNRCVAHTASSPNNDPPVDGMASILAHELSETVTDPLFTAWLDANGDEIGDKCSWNFGTTFAAPNGSLANVTLGGFDYLIQQEFSNASDSCVMSYSATPDYSLSVSPGSQTAVQGATTGNYTVTVNPINGFSSGVTLSVTGLPAGATLNAPTPNPASTTATFSIATGTAATGSYPLTITGTSGALTHTTTATLVVVQPDYSLSVSPGSQSAVQGAATGNYTVTVNPTNGFSSGVTLSVTGLPAGATLNAPTPNPASTTATFSIATGTAAAGSYPLTITGTSGALTHTAAATLVVTDYSLSVSPGSQSAVQGATTGNYTVTVNPISGFSNAVTLSVTGLPAGATLNAPTPNPTSTTATFSIATGTAAAGSYPLTITGTSGALTHTTAATLVVMNYSLSVSPGSQSAVQGATTGNYTVTVNPINGFSSAVTLSVTGLPAGATLNAPTPNPTSTTATFSIATGTAVAGSYSLTITGTSGALTHTAAATLVVMNYSLSVSPGSQTALQGATTGNYTVTVNPINGFSNAVTLSVTGLPAGATLNAPSPNPTSTTATFSIATGTAAAGSYPLTITGTSGTLMHTAAATLVVVKPDYSLSISPGSQAASLGKTTQSYTVTVIPANGFAGIVNFAVTGLPAGASLNPAPGSSSTSSIFAVAVGASAPGTYTLTITGTNGPLSHSVNATLIVNPGVGQSRVGIFRQGYFWLEDVDGNQQFNQPPDQAFAFGGIAGDIPITGDWNGDGRTKAGVYRPSNGLFILDTNGDQQFDAGDAVYNLGVGTQAGDLPVVGDWNGDGRTKVGLFRQGFFWILDYNGNGVFEQGVDKTYAFGGVAGDVPVVGDWTGTGTSKIGLFRMGFFWILDANGNGSLDNINGAGGDQAFAYGGIAGDVPLVGDWNGDGASKVGVFRQGFFWVLDANGNHTFDGTGPGQDLAFAFGGISGDVPVVGKWSSAIIAATSGTPQSTAINTAFAAPLTATLTDLGGSPLAGVLVTFAAPTSGASGTFAGGATTATALTNASGIATSPTFTANGISGSVAVTASAPRVGVPATFSLTIL